jgi:glycosyltransferase involved in cell wall biosynthesis
MDRGGVETWLVQVLRQLDPARVRMDFLVHTDRDCAYDDEIRSLGGRLFRCPGHTKLPRYARRFRRILDDHGPFDVVHSHVHHFSGFVLWLAKRAGIRCRVAHSHSDTRDSDGGAPPWRSAYLRIARALVARCATNGLAASRDSARALFGPRWEQDRRWRILHCGIDLRPFESATGDARVHTELGIPPGSFILGHVGRFRPEKNHEFLLEITQQARQIEPLARLLLVGDGPLRPRVERMAEAAGLSPFVVFAGSRDDVPRILASAMHVLLLPSRREGLPLVVLEAQAAGVPVLASEIVTTEVDVVPGLVQRAALAAGAREWASRAIAHARAAVVPATPLSLLERSSFSLRESVSRLTDAYHEWARPVTPAHA